MIDKSILNPTPAKHLKRIVLKQINPKHKTILRFAKSQGMLSPLWLTPGADSKNVKRSFQELEKTLHKSLQDERLRGISLDDIDEFVWKLKKAFAFEGWEGIAPFLFSSRRVEPGRDIDFMNS